jgi:PhnB protein
MMIYQSLLGGSIETMLTYGESPMASSTDPQWHGRIVHATLLLGDIELTGVDVMPGAYQRPQGFFVTLAVDGVARARQIFTSLGQGGEIRVPFEETFWSPGFGVLIDRFGIPWEINASAGPVVA